MSHLDPSTLGIEPPRQDNARLEDVKDVLAVGHGGVDIGTRLVCVKLCEPISLWHGRLLRFRGIERRVESSTECVTRGSCADGMKQCWMRKVWVRRRVIEIVEKCWAMKHP